MNAQGSPMPKQSILAPASLYLTAIIECVSRIPLTTLFSKLPYFRSICEYVMQLPSRYHFFENSRLDTSCPTLAELQLATVAARQLILKISS